MRLPSEGTGIRGLFLTICAILSLLLILFVYFNVTLTDAYFPYWDPYYTRLYSEKLGITSPFYKFGDPLFYYITRILHEVTGIDYYSIIKYGNFFLIAFLFLVLFLLFKEVTNAQKHVDKSLIIIALIYYFLCFYSYLRFSMTLRENLVISFAFIFIYLLARFDRSGRLNFSNILLLSLVYSYTISAHMLVALIITGIFSLYLLNCLIKRRNRRELLTIIVVTCTISLPFLYAQSFGIIAQFYHGQEFIIASGLTVASNLIKEFYFNLPLDILLLAGGVLFYVRFLACKLKGIDPKRHKLFLFYLLTVLFLVLVCYIPQFGMKQNRFAIYLYPILSFFLVFLLKGLRNLKLKSLIVPLILTLILATMVPRVLQYPGYYPINERRMNYIESQLPTLLGEYDMIYAGPSVRTIMDYLGYENRSIPFESNFSSIPENLDRPIVIVIDDYYTYQFYFPSVFERFEELKESNEVLYDEESRTWIVTPIELSTLSACPRGECFLSRTSVQKYGTDGNSETTERHLILKKIL